MQVKSSPLQQGGPSSVDCTLFFTGAPRAPAPILTDFPVGTFVILPLDTTMVSQWQLDENNFPKRNNPGD